MAQTGFTPIQLYSTSTAAAAPVAGNLTNSTLGSELAINITDGKLFYKDNANAVQVIGWKTVPTTAGGTGLTTYAAGDLSYYATGTTFTKLAIGTAGQILTSTGTAPQWSTLSGVAVTTFSAGTTGFTPNSATSGAVTLAGTLATTNGGTGLTSFTANRIFYASSTSVMAQSAGLTFDGSNFATTGNINGVNITASGSLLWGSNGTYAAGCIYADANWGGIFRARTASPGQATFMWANSAGAEHMRLSPTGGLNIGGTADPGVGNLSVNGVIRIGSNQAVNGPAVSAYKSTNQSITTFTPTKITFDTESFDTNSNFASSTFTPTVAGYYQISAGFFPSADSTTFSRAFISIYKNGAEWQRLQDVTTIGQFITFLGASGSCLVYCNGTTDYIEAYGFIIGTNPVISSGSTITYFDAVMVRGA